MLFDYLLRQGRSPLSRHPCEGRDQERDRVRSMRGHARPFFDPLPLFLAHRGRFFQNLRKWAKNTESRPSPPGQEGCPKDGVVDCQPCEKSQRLSVFSSFSIDHPCPLLSRRGTHFATSARKTYPCEPRGGEGTRSGSFLSFFSTFSLYQMKKHAGRKGRRDDEWAKYDLR